LAPSAGIAALEAIESVAVCNPLAVGVNARSSVQVPPAGMLIAQLSVSENSVAGANVSELIATGELPTLRSSSGTVVPNNVELTPTASPEVVVVVEIQALRIRNDQACPRPG
jgi:hypothetical protein